MKMLFVALSLMASINTYIPDVESAGEYRITEYCQFCNDPEGYESASGEKLHEGDCAMNGVPLGTEIMIDGETYVVKDRCGIENTVDIFKETEGGCHCERMECKEVSIIRK